MNTMPVFKNRSTRTRDLYRVSPALPEPAAQAQKLQRVASKTSGGGSAINAAVLGHVRNAVAVNCEDHFIPNIDAPIGETLNAELDVFSSTLTGGRFDDTSEQTQYAHVIQNIQARFKSGGFTYAFDKDTEGVTEYWSSPSEVVADSGQSIDCEDFAFMAREYGEHAQSELGFGGRFAVHMGYVDHDREQGHGICVYHAEDGSQYVIDGTFFESGRGDISQLTTVAEYTEERNFEWIQSPQGHLMEGELGQKENGASIFLRSRNTADLDAVGKPSDVATVEGEGENITHALDVKTSLDAEPEGFKKIMDFLSSKREGLGDLSLLELGGILMGPLLIIGDLLKLRSVNTKVARDSKLTNIIPGATVVDGKYHKTRRTIAGAKAFLDTARYVAFLTICAGAGVLAAPLVALGVGSIRCCVGAAEAVHTTLKKESRLKRRKQSQKRVQQSLRACHAEAKTIFDSRINYKLKKSRLSGSRVWGGLKAFAYGGSGLGMATTATLAALAGTIVAVNPIILGVALGFGLLLGLLKTGESIYNGALLREQNRALGDGEALIPSRIERIKDKKRSLLSRVGASLNLFGWVTDAVDDRIGIFSPRVRALIKITLAPFYAWTFLTERKTFNEEAVFQRLGREYTRVDVSASQRATLLKTSAAYYGIPEKDVLVKWMGPAELEQVRAYVDKTQRPTSPIVQAYLRLWKKKENRVGALKAKGIQEFRAALLDQADTLAPVKMKFAGSYGLAR
jgi:predicted transglutaminase-like cysteine proteinase